MLLCCTPAGVPTAGMPTAGFESGGYGRGVPPRDAGVAAPYAQAPGAENGTGQSAQKWFAKANSDQMG